MGEVLDESLMLLLRDYAAIIAALLAGVPLGVFLAYLVHRKDKTTIVEELRFFRALASAAISEATGLRAANAALEGTLGADQVDIGPGRPWDWEAGDGLGPFSSLSAHRDHPDVPAWALAGVGAQSTPPGETDP